MLIRPNPYLANTKTVWNCIVMLLFSASFYRELCDIGDVGKLTRDQFALALYLINQKLSKGIDPPQTLSPEMIPPCDRLARQVQCSLNHGFLLLLLF